MPQSCGSGYQICDSEYMKLLIRKLSFSPHPPLAHKKCVTLSQSLCKLCARFLSYRKTTSNLLIYGLIFLGSTLQENWFAFFCQFSRQPRFSFDAFPRVTCAPSAFSCPRLVVVESWSLWNLLLTLSEIMFDGFL